MRVREVGRMPAMLPADDDHPYRTGAWKPQLVEYDADDLDVIEGAIPAGLEGIYLRNTENPVLPAIGRYHPFDGDGMLHSIRFRGGRASYRNRFVRTAGLAAELAAGEPLWAGIIEPPARSKRDGWGARTRLKDASSTDVVVHGGRAITTHYQCGEAYQLDPETLAQLGPAAWTPPAGVSAHTKTDPATGELLFFSYGLEAPYLWYGEVDARGERTLLQPIPLPGPRLPHDMAFTEHYAILNDFPLYWDPARIAEGSFRPAWHPEQPSRFAVIPRGGGEVRWFEAAPTYVLHWANAYEDGDTIVLDGYFQSEPMTKNMLCIHSMGARPHRWRFDLRTGKTTEERLVDDVSEFPTTAVQGQRHRYVWSMTAPRGWFLFDGIVRHDTGGGATQRYQFPDGVYASESPFARRGSGEDDGWLVTFTTDVARDASECQIFDAAHIDAGPIARVALPARISSGTHAVWAPQ